METPSLTPFHLLHSGHYNEAILQPASSGKYSTWPAQPPPERESQRRHRSRPAAPASHTASGRSLTTGEMDKHINTDRQIHTLTPYTPLSVYNVALDPSLLVLKPLLSLYSCPKLIHRDIYVGLKCRIHIISIKSAKGRDHCLYLTFQPRCMN